MIFQVLVFCFHISLVEGFFVFVIVVQDELPDFPNQWDS